MVCSSWPPHGFRRYRSKRCFTYKKKQRGKRIDEQRLRTRQTSDNKTEKRKKRKKATKKKKTPKKYTTPSIPQSQISPLGNPPKEKRASGRSTGNPTGNSPLMHQSVHQADIQHLLRLTIEHREPIASLLLKLWRHVVQIQFVSTTTRCTRANTGSNNWASRQTGPQHN